MKIRAAALFAAVGFALAAPGSAAPDAGAFLAARQAFVDRDHSAAARYFDIALRETPDQPELLENALMTFISVGDMTAALPIAARLSGADPGNGLSAIVMMADHVARGDFAGAERYFAEGARFSPLLDGLMRGWIQLGLGRMSEASDMFDAMTDNPTVELFGQYHKALALAAVGFFEGADALLTGEEGRSLRLTRGAHVAHAQIMVQLEQRDRAVAMLDDLLAGNGDPEMIDLRARILQGDAVDYSYVTRAEEGAAEVFLTIASALSSEGDDRFGLLYARLAQHLRPGDTEILMLVAAILESQRQYALAIEAYVQVADNHPAHHQAVSGQAQALYELGHEQEAVALLADLAARVPDVMAVHLALGDLHRRMSDFEAAARAYSAAVALIEEPEPRHWFVYYVRGMSLERTGRWDEAEADFRLALELNPDQPYVLNYLGYSLVEQRRNLEEAEAMIRTAVAARPDDGYIVDSLGWVLYRLGRHEEAVEHMERAVELRPEDAVINDHLGDVYWKVGRKREARFQWSRALAFGPADDLDMDRVRRKLEVGLDQVLREEAAAGNGD
ncbi:MAG: tetratricopeptide repeat protein [Rhodobacteraceae bacterium]|nr:tetratricopeptide repeat protein [Paracoccaceae bacterium]